jgi:hypothetical protein
MTTPTPPQAPPPGAGYGYDDDEISLAELIQKGREWARIVWGERRFVAKVVGVSVAIGLVIAFGSRPEYTASTKILPYRSGGGSSGLSGLAGLAGVRLPQGAADQTITADLYPEVAKTVDFRVAVAETPIRFSSLPEPMTPMQYFREIARPSVTDVLRRYTIGLPRTIASAILPSESEPSRTAPAESSGPTIADYDRAYRGVLAEMGSRVTVTSDKNSAAMIISATMPDRYASADLVRIAADRLMVRVIEYEAKKATEQLRFIEEQALQAKVRLDRVQRDQALLSDRMRGTVSATAQLETQRLQREYTLAFDVYRQFSSELEQARIKKSQDTPVFTVLEQVVVPDRRSSPKRILLLLLALSIGFAGALGTIGLRRLAQAP